MQATCSEGWTEPVSLLELKLKNLRFPHCSKPRGIAAEIKFSPKFIISRLWQEVPQHPQLRQRGIRNASLEVIEVTGIPVTWRIGIAERHVRIGQHGHGQLNATTKLRWYRPTQAVPRDVQSRVWHCRVILFGFWSLLNSSNEFGLGLVQVLYRRERLRSAGVHHYMIHRRPPKTSKSLSVKKTNGYRRAEMVHWAGPYLLGHSAML
jgi:hypothetical protein